MKKTLKVSLILLAFSMILTMPVFAASEKIVIFPVDKNVKGSTLIPYPNVINIVSNEVANSLSKHSNYSIIDLKSSNNLIRSKGLYPKYTKLLEDYKNTANLDYDLLGIISEKLGATKILLISGGYDMQQFLLKERSLPDWRTSSLATINKAYRLGIVLTLVDAQSGLVVWEKAYNKDINIDDYPYPNPTFGENIMATQKIKKFARYLSYESMLEMKFYLSKSGVTQVHSEIINTDTNNNSATDGSKTKDGHSTSTDNEYLINNKKNNYKNWVKNSL